MSVTRCRGGPAFVGASSPWPGPESVPDPARCVSCGMGDRSARDTFGRQHLARSCEVAGTHSPDHESGQLDGRNTAGARAGACATVPDAHRFPPRARKRIRPLEPCSLVHRAPEDTRYAGTRYRLAGGLTRHHSGGSDEGVPRDRRERKEAWGRPRPSAPAEGSAEPRDGSSWGGGGEPIVMAFETSRPDQSRSAVSAARPPAIGMPVSLRQGMIRRRHAKGPIRGTERRRRADRSHVN